MNVMNCKNSIGSYLLPLKKEESSPFFGRSFAICSGQLSAWTDVMSCTEAFHSAVKFCICATAALEPAVFLHKLSVTFLDVDQFIDGLRFISDVKKALELQFYRDAVAGEMAKSASDIAFLFADLGSSVSLLGYLGVIDFQRVLILVGSISVFGVAMPAIAGLTLIGAYSLHIQTIAFLLLGVSSYNKIAESKDSKGTLHDQLLLATCISEVFHKSFIIGYSAALSTPSGLLTAGCLGMIANSLGIASAYIEAKS